MEREMALCNRSLVERLRSNCAFRLCWDFALVNFRSATAEIEAADQSHHHNAACNQEVVGHGAGESGGILQILAYPAGKQHSDDGEHACEYKEQRAATPAHVKRLHLVRSQIAFVGGQAHVRHRVRILAYDREGPASTIKSRLRATLEGRSDRCIRWDGTPGRRVSIQVRRVWSELL